MTKLVLSDLVSLENQNTAITTVNNNSASIVTALENTLSRDGTTPNFMSADLDMNSHRILNLPVPGSDTEPVRLFELKTASGNAAALAQALTNAQASATAAASSATASASSANSASTSATNSGTSATASSASATSAAASLASFQALVSGVLTNQRKAVTGSYSLLNADKGKTIALGGTALYTFTVNAASGYDANYAVRVINEDTTRAKLMNINGTGTFFLYPLQVLEIYNQNNVWLLRKPGRWRLQADTTFYINDTTNSVNNDGLDPASPVGSQALVNRLYQDLDCNGFIPTLQVLVSINAGLVFVEELVGNTYFILQGEVGHRDTITMLVPTTSIGIYVKNRGIVKIKYMTIGSVPAATGTIAIVAERGGFVDLYQVEISGLSVGIKTIGDYATIELADVFYAGGAFAVVFQADGGNIFMGSSTHVITSNISSTYFILATNKGLVRSDPGGSWNLGAFSVGGYRGYSAAGSVIRSANGSSTYYPGSVSITAADSSSFVD